MIGTTVSHYKILEKLGEGGMGIVYKAQDTRLDRFVALKFLPQRLESSEADRARFIQEAKAAAALNHPNICTVIDIAERDGQMFIVMEFVDGQTLQEKKQSLNFRQAVDIGIQVAEGLSAAHEKGIVHRDIKPENIMIRKDGIAQIMDFGLAKLRGLKATRLTREGSTVGTAGYMSPEQVQGLETDHRSDIFSLGVVLYELFAGQLPFNGVHETALAYEIVNIDAAPISSIKPEIDPQLDAIVLECLEKDPRERTQSAAQIAIDLKRYRRESSRQRVSRTIAAVKSSRGTAEQPSERTGGGRRKREWIWPAIAAVMFVALVLVVWNPWRREPTAVRSAMRFTVDLSDAAPLIWSQSQSGLAVSPDGKNFAYTAQIPTTSQIYLHHMDQLTSQPIPGTENSAEPVFSPDGEWIAFNTAQERLSRVSIFGGAPETVCRTNGQIRGMWWGPDNTIYYGHISSCIYRVPARGGSPEPVTALDTAAGEISHRFPQLLPDGKTILFTIKKNNITSFDEAIIAAQRLGSAERKILVRGGTYARYLPSGDLMYLRGNTIYAVPFDVDRLEVTGPPVAIEEGGWTNPGSGQANVGFSNNGLLVFAPSGPLSYGRFALAWMDRRGHIGSLLDTLRSYFSGRLSPDGEKLVTDINAANDDVWLYQISRGTLTRLTFAGGNNNFPIWSPDGRYVVYTSEKGGPPNLYRKQWDGSAGEERLTIGSNAQTPRSMTPDGKVLSFEQNGEIWILPLDGGRKPYPFIKTSATAAGGIFSPDGRWMAYTSNESGRNEVYVTAFPKREGNWQISNQGGTAPIWSGNGRELFFTGGSSLMVVTVSAGSTFDFSEPKKLCDLPPSDAVWDITRDGQRFLIRASQLQEVTLPRLEVVTDWFQEVKEKIAAGKN